MQELWLLVSVVTLNDKRSYTISETELTYPFTTMDVVHLTKHALTSTYPPTAVTYAALKSSPWRI